MVGLLKARRITVKNWILVFAFVSLSVSAHAQQDPIKLGILLDTSTSLGVMFIEKKPKNPSPLIWSMVVIAPVMIANTFRDSSRNADLSERLRSSIGDTVDRRAVYQRELTAAFAQHTTDPRPSGRNGTFNYHRGCGHPGGITHDDRHCSIAQHEKTTGGKSVG